MSIQKIILMIATIMLILTLISIGIALYNKKYDDKYPPIIAQCPDYWLDNSKGNESRGSKCTNIKNLGKDECSKEMDFSDSMWQGASGLCNKKKWARHCDLVWDGVTNTSADC